MTFETEEDVAVALDRWLRGGRGGRTHVCGFENGNFFARLTSRGEDVCLGLSKLSSSDATANALNKTGEQE